MAKLIVKEGPSKVMEYELTDEVKVVGRDRTNDIRINHALVSRNHAQFFKQANGYAVRDLESKNGTFVNDGPLTPGVARALAEGDQVRIGPTTFEFSDDKAGTGSGTAASAAAAAAAAEADKADGPGTRVLELNRPLFDPSKVPGIEELRAGQKQLVVLLDTSKAMAAVHDAKGVHQVLLAAVNEHLAPQRAFLFRMSENNSALVLVGQQLAAGEQPGQPLLAARLAVAQAIRDKAAVIRSGMMSAEQTGGAPDNRLQLAAPLLHEGALLGVLYLDAREQTRPYKLNELRLLAALSQLAADFLGKADTKGGGAGFSGHAIEQMRREASLLGESAPVAALRQFAAKSGALNTPVLLYGPPGSGKEHLARLIHLSGSRAPGPFVICTGPALPKSRTDVDLFGEEIEGQAPTVGKVEWAEGGTLLVDQLQEISATAQERLFDLISKGEYARVGSDQPRRADVRIIVSTNVDPKEFLGHRLFHQPLIQLLGDSMYEMPSLASRAADIPALADHFLERCRFKADRKILGFSQEAVAALSTYAWPGNLQELRLAVHYAVFTGRDREIGITDLPELVRNGVAGNGSARG